MTPGRIALLLSPALPLAPLLALALAGCGGEAEKAGRPREASPPPFGFEMAMAATGAGAQQDAAAAPEAAGAAGRAAPALAPIALTPEELAARIRQGKVRLIDVRTAEELAEGMIPGAEHMPLASFDPAALAPAEDGSAVVLYCRSGRRSAIAAERLAAATGRPAEHLEGGIIAWEAAGEPTTKP